MDEEQYKKELAESGVDLPELNEAPEELTEEPKEEPTEEPTPEETSEEEPTEPLQETPKEPRKRSIYDEYKEKKQELRSEKEQREQVERERDELKAKLDALSNADTPQEKREAQDELEAFAKEINADPQALRKMRELFLKDMKPQNDEALAKDLAEFKAWKSQNAQMLEKQMFEEEFKAVTPTIKELFPNASAEEMEAIKTELDKVSHTPDYHDKDLDYVAFKVKDALSALVSPKKRGVEPKGRADASEVTTDFNPEADLAKMTPEQREKWTEDYQKLTQSTELTTNDLGQRVIL